MAAPMRLRALRDGNRLVLKVLMAHEMETGQRKDADGVLIPAWFIRQVEVWVDAERALSADWGPAVSKNPFLQIELLDVPIGARVRVLWLDSRGERREDAIEAP